MLPFLQILTRVHPTLLTHVGTHIQIPNPEHMPLTVENIGRGPRDLPAVSLCHYGEQNGDAMRDPEMCFELGLAGGAHLIPYFWRDDYVAVEQVSRAIIRDHYVALLELQKQHEKFAEMWDKKLRVQGYEEAFTSKCILG